MKSKLTLALAVSILTIGLSAFSNRADAQAPFAANTHSTSVTLPLGGIGTINVIELPEVGTYVISGQQNLSASPTTAQTPVLCYMTTQPGGSTPLPSGPYSMTTIPLRRRLRHTPAQRILHGHVVADEPLGGVPVFWPGTSFGYLRQHYCYAGSVIEQPVSMSTSSPDALIENASKTTR
jgi:hypothetical protein